MATGPTVIIGPHDGRTVLLQWTLGASEAGLPAVVPHKADKTVHVYGTFGGAVQIEGSLEDIGAPAHWEVLRDPQGTLLSGLTARTLKAILENVYLIRPVSGAGVVAVTVRVLIVG